MGAPPAVPSYGKDSDRLNALAIAHKTLIESGDLLLNWPVTVASPALFKERIDLYEEMYKEAIYRDNRAIARRNEACSDAFTTWQKIVNYICATEEDNTATLEQMGIYAKTR